MTPDSDIRKHLQTITLNGGVKIYDRVPENTASAYVHISELTCTDFSTADSLLWDCEVLFDIVTTVNRMSGGRAQSDSISSEIIEALIDNRDTLTGWQIIRCRPLTTNYIDEYSDSSLMIRKLVRMQIIVEQIK